VLDAIETELEAIEERIFANTAPRANIEALYYVEAEGHHAQACDRAAHGIGGQALRRARADGLPGPGGIFPRRLRPPGAPQPVASTPCAIPCNTGAAGQPRHDHHRRERGDQAPRGPTPPWWRCRP
jgi:hypothetical protein